MDHTKKPTYFFGIDALRVLSILAVIFIHSTTKTLANIDHNVVDGALSLYLNQASRFAVPLFFLISGFVLELNYKDLSWLSYFKKRTAKIALPFVFWSFIYFYLGWGMDVSKFVSMDFVRIFINGKASYHLYFIPTLVIFYIAFPFLHKFLLVLRKIPVFLLLWFVQILLLSFDYYVSPFKINEILRITLLTYSMFITGMLASLYKDKLLNFASRFWFILASTIVILSGIIFFHVVELTTLRKTTSFIYNQHSPLNYFYTLLVALLGSYLFNKTHILSRPIKKLSSLSFFVFFVHVLVLTNLWNWFIKTRISNDNSLLKELWFDPSFFLAICIISFGIAYVVHKIPYASKITG